MRHVMTKIHVRLIHAKKSAAPMRRLMRQSVKTAMHARTKIPVPMVNVPVCRQTVMMETSVRLTAVTPLQVATTTWPVTRAVLAAFRFVMTPTRAPTMTAIR
jgi:hypothetical protein